MENEYKEEDMKKINEAVNNMKLQSPVRKINFSDDNRLTAGGMWLMTFKDVDDLLDGIVQTDDIEDTTMLFFEARHVSEVVQILYGPLRLFEENKFISRESIFDTIEDILSLLAGRFIPYTKLRSNLTSILNTTLKGIRKCNNSILVDNFYCLFEKIWFISYAEIDKICDLAIEEFKKRGTKDEGNGSASGPDETSGEG